MSAFRALSALFSLSTSLFFLVNGAIFAANQSYQGIGLELLTAPSVALYSSGWLGGMYALHFLFPRTFWFFTFGNPLPEEAFVVWKATAFTLFMVGIAPLALEPTWRMFAWMLFLWPLHLFLTHLSITVLYPSPRLYMFAAPLYHLAALFPVLLIDAATI